MTPSVSRALLKYGEVARINLRSRWAYLWDQLLANVHLFFIMFVFVQLWKVTYAGSGGSTLGGYTMPEMIWYLVFTEAILGSLPRIHAVMEQEVRDGDLAMRLNKPYNYLLFHFSSFAGEAVTRLVASLLVGGVTAYVLVGGVAFRWTALPVLVGIYVTTSALHFCYNASIGLLAFWTEDVTGFFFVFDKLKWLLGGMLLPVEVYPASVRRVVEVLPFRHMFAGPARLAVKFSPADALALLGSQAVWLVVFGAVCFGLYRLGVRRVDLNGG